jgi:hypothetical protein
MCSRLCIADLRHAVVARLLHGGEQQGVGLFAAFVRRHVIGAVEIDRVDVFALDEFQNLHHLRRLRRDFADVLVVHHDVLALFVLVAFDDLVARDWLVFGLAIEYLLDARMVLFVELVKADGFAPRRRKQAHGKRYKPERQMPFPCARCHMFVTRFAPKNTGALYISLVQL